MGRRTASRCALTVPKMSARLTVNLLVTGLNN
jgi:hypothetical protein